MSMAKREAVVTKKPSLGSLATMKKKDFWYFEIKLSHLAFIQRTLNANSTFYVLTHLGVLYKL